MLVSLNEWKRIIKPSNQRFRAYNYGISTNIEKYLADNLIGRFWNTSNIN